MTYTIKEVSEMLNIPASTLRYYDKEGLLPEMERKESGYRLFTEQSIRTLRFIECLKDTGMPIKDIHQFMQWLKEGDNSIQQRLEMFHERRRVVEAQLAKLQKTLEVIEYKCWYYETAAAAGTLAVHENNPSKRKDPLED